MVFSILVGWHHCIESVPRVLEMKCLIRCWKCDSDRFPCVFICLLTIVYKCAYRYVCMRNPIRIWLHKNIQHSTFLIHTLLYVSISLSDNSWDCPLSEKSPSNHVTAFSRTNPTATLQRCFCYGELWFVLWLWTVWSWSVRTVSNIS